MAPQLVVGDRVRARTLSGVPVGALGRITQRLVSAPDLFFVVFDGYAHWKLMHATELERVTNAPAHEKAS